MSAHPPLATNDTSSYWWSSSSPKIYSGYSYSPYCFQFIRSSFASLSSNPSYPAFFRSWAADVATYEDDFWWLNVLWAICAVVCPLLMYAIEISVDKNARHWWRSQRSFHPPQWLNCLCVVQFIACNNFGLFTARWVLGRQLNSIHSYSLFDFCQWIVIMPVADILTYWTHWFQHYYPTVYRYSHGTHHKVKFSTMWIVYYASPFDFLINTVWLYALLFYFIDFHFYQIVLLTAIQAFHLTWTHSNYRDVSNGHHQIHHLEPRYNFCPGNPLIDKLFGTLLTVEEYSKIRDPEKMDGGDKDE